MDFNTINKQRLLLIEGNPHWCLSFLRQNPGADKAALSSCIINSGSKTAINGLEYFINLTQEIAKWQNQRTITSTSIGDRHE